ncbi:MAG: hypothetical protein K2N38_06425 [Oscillospiraceae bacterium]|nr:hypothetical protein [Oscillospiraceae bacterium]
MAVKNYTNPNDRRRFGFSESGEFKAPYKGAHIFVALLIAAGILIDVVVFVALVGLGEAIGLPRGDMFTALVQGFIMVFTVVLTIFVVLLGIRTLSSGFSCKYTADEEKFILTYGGDVHTFYYDDVQAVHFIPRTSLGKVIGYDVTIKINGAEENFSIVSELYVSEKSTPFNIIRERAEMAHDAKYNERAMNEGRNAVGDSRKPIFAEDIVKARESKKSVFDRMAELCGNDADMSGVSLGKDDKNSASAVRAYNAGQEAGAENAPVIREGIEGGYDVSKVMEKVSPTVRGYASDMPAVSKDGKITAAAETYTDDFGMSRSLDDIQGRGTFNVPLPKKTAALLWVIVLALLVGAVFFTVMLISTMIVAGLIALVLVVPVIILLSIAIVIIKCIRQGREYSYRADGREFVVTAKNEPEQHICYNEVTGVTYSELKFLWFENGYNVEITTNYGVIRYKYVYPKFRHAIKTEDLPFELIRKNAERLKNK